MTSLTHDQPKLRARLAPLPLRRLQLLGCEGIIVAYFLSLFRYKIWFVTTAAVLALTVIAALLGTVRVRGLLRDLWPIGLLFVYLIAASFQSEFSRVALYWSAVDSIGMVVAALFWIAMRNNSSADIRMMFIRLVLISAVVAFGAYRVLPTMSRIGGLSLMFYPLALPFLWTEIIGGRHRRFALFALGVMLAILFLSRSRAPLGAALLVLGLSFLWIGRTLMQRVKLGLLLTIMVTLIAVILMSIPTTRYIVQMFVSRTIDQDVMWGDVYVPAEPRDGARESLEQLVKERFLDAQPFGIGYGTTSEHYLRIYRFPLALHNMYHAWAFEGGVFGAFIFLAITIRHYRALRKVQQIARTMEEELMARSLLIGTVGVFFIGMFHQMHQGPVLYMLFGLGLGLKRRVWSDG
ncbi:MAG TPA: O-antigen ligase family protein [Thermoanaerobaculia bacterium]|nr:O-antigen ligase family protein [Thermoanaerobaculia bacterium]